MNHYLIWFGGCAVGLIVGSTVGYIQGLMKEREDISKLFVAIKKDLRDRGYQETADKIHIS